ncbi:MAG: TolC family protein [Halarcobacter sp.]
MHKILLLVLLIFINLYSKTFNFDEVLEETLKNNKKIKLQKLNLKSVNSDIEKVKSFSYGELNFVNELSRTNHAGYVFNSKLSSREASFKDFGFSQFGQPINTQPSDLNYPKDRNNFNSKITYDIPLFTGFQLSNQEEILKLKHKAELFQLNLDKKSLEFEVLKAYNGAIVAKEFIKAVKKAKKTIKQVVISADEFYKEGYVTKIDVKQAKVHQLNIQSKLTEAENRFSLALAYLKFLTSNDNIDDVKDLKIVKFQDKDLKKLYTQALNTRDDLKMVEEYKKGMKKNIDLNKSSYYPKVYSHLEYGVNDGVVDFNEDKDYYMALLGVKITLFDASRKYDVQKSKIEFNKTVLKQNQLEDAIKLQLQQSILNFQTKQKIYKEKIEALQLSNEVLDQSKQMYKNRLISMIDLLKQETLYRQTEASMLNAKYETTIALGKLYLAIGKSLNEKGNL